jgi:hypothetical protein
MTKISLVPTIQNGIALGLKNFVALVVNSILYILTIWVPYLNVGTTIAMTSLPAKMGQEEGLSMVEIFNKDYRRHMGEYFLTAGLMFPAILTANIFFIVPGIILSLNWSQALLLMLEKNFTPLTAIRKSQEITEGNQWVIFLAPAVFMVGAMIIIAIFNAINETLGSIVSFIIMVLLLPIFLGIQAEIYSKLAANIKPEK